MTGGAAVWPTVLLCMILLMCSAFFSSAETALFGLQPVDIEAMSGQTEKRVRALVSEPRQTLASILIGNETVNIALSTVSAGLLLQLFPETSLDVRAASPLSRYRPPPAPYVSLLCGPQVTVLPEITHPSKSRLLAVE